MRATVRENYARSLYFLDGRLADAIIEANKKTKAIETFLAGAVRGDRHPGEECRRSKTCAQPPYKATVDFEKVYYAAADHTEIRREKYVAQLRVSWSRTACRTP